MAAYLESGTVHLEEMLWLVIEIIEGDGVFIARVGITHLYACLNLHEEVVVAGAKLESLAAVGDDWQGITG